MASATVAVVPNIDKLKELNKRLEAIVFEMEDAITVAPTIAERWSTDDLFSSGPERMIPDVAQATQDVQVTVQAPEDVLPNIELRALALERMVVILFNRLTETVQRIPDQYQGDREFIVACWRTLGWDTVDIKGYFSGNIIPTEIDSISDVEDIITKHIERLLKERQDGTRS